MYNTQPMITNKTKIVTTLNVGQDPDKLAHSCIAPGNVKWYSHSARNLAVSYKTKYADYQMIQQLHS